MSHHGNNTALDRLVVRTFAPHDQHAVSHLYQHGLLAGQLAPNDTGADIENIGVAYFSDVANHFWVAELDHRIIGMIGVMREEGHKAEIRRLRVEPEWQHAEIIPIRLMEAALYHCKVHGFLKIVFDTRFEKESAVGLFDRFGFQHTRSRTHHDKETLEFYLDLYRQTKEEGRA